jgi:multiple sugar transport system substrate-binding protein
MPRAILYTYLLAQDVAFFPDPRSIELTSPEAVRILDFFRRISVERLGTLNQDTPAAIASFVSGEGGVYPTAPG